MNVVIMQPYLMPYIGYFQLIASADVFVSLDDVNFIKSGWINRNNLCFNKRRTMFTLPLSKASQNKMINEVEVSTEFPVWRCRFLRSLETWYGKQPFFAEGMEIVEEMLSPDRRGISEINFNGLCQLASKMGLKTKFLTASSLNAPRTKGASRLRAIAMQLGADAYVNAPGGKNLYCDDMFEPYGIRLRFLAPHLSSYPMQEWMPGLSILDAVMRLGCRRVGKEIIPGWKLERGQKSFHTADCAHAEAIR